MLLLTGCATTQGVSETERSFTESVFFAGRKLPEPPKEDPQKNLGCPAASILDGTAAYRGGGTDAARGVTFQAAISDVARECRPQGATMAIKVGVEGRLLLGDAGKPGTFTVPLRVAVRKGEQVVYTQLHKVSVTVPADDSQAPFVFVDERVIVPIGAEDPADEYKILVGLDPQGGAARPAKAKKRR